MYSYYHHDFSFNRIYRSTYNKVRYVIFDGMKFPKLYPDLLNKQLNNCWEDLNWFLFCLKDEMISFNCLQRSFSSKRRNTFTSITFISLVGEAVHMQQTKLKTRKINLEQYSIDLNKKLRCTPSAVTSVTLSRGAESAVSDITADFLMDG